VKSRKISYKTLTLSRGSRFFPPEFRLYFDSIVRYNLGFVSGQRMVGGENERSNKKRKIKPNDPVSGSTNAVLGWKGQKTKPKQTLRKCEAGQNKPTG
jgi:hypothetical protein